MDRHRRMAQQRGQPDALGGHRVRGRERVRAREEDSGDHQADEEDRDAGEHRGRPGHHLAMTMAGHEEDRRGCDREHERPEQQRAGLAPPEGGQLVEQRRRRRRVIGDQRDREVRAHEGRLERDRRDRQQGEQRVDRPAGRDHPATVPAAPPISAATGRVQQRETGRRSGSPRPARPSSRAVTGRSRRARGRPRLVRELRRALRDQAVLLGHEDPALEPAGDDHLAALPERVGDDAAVETGILVVALAIGDVEPRSEPCRLIDRRDLAGQLVGCRCVRRRARRRALAPRSRR